MVRSTMTALIARLRRMIADKGDGAGGGQVFADQDLQEFLDASRSEVRYLPLTPLQSIAPGGGVQWRIFTAPWSDWEDGAELVDTGFNPLPLAPTMLTADLLTGRWEFSDSVTPGVRLSGFTYDLAAAAVDALESWAAQVKLKYDFASADQKLSRSQMISSLLTLAGTYRNKCRPVCLTMVRDDINGA